MNINDHDADAIFRDHVTPGPLYDPTLDYNKDWHEVYRNVRMPAHTAYFKPGEEDEAESWKPPQPGQFPIESPPYKHAEMYSQKLAAKKRRSEFEALPEWQKQITRKYEQHAMRDHKEYDSRIANCNEAMLSIGK